MARKVIDPRTSRKRRRNPVIYIICEGTDTEIHYFKRFRTRYSQIDIRPVPSQYKAADDLVRHARDTIRLEPYYPEDGDQIWCVFDRDDNTDENLRKAELMAQKSNYQLAFSNPSFELWFLLHYTMHQGYLADPAAAIHALQAHIPDYRKAADYYDVLLPSQSKAIARAKRLIQSHETNGHRLHSRDANPCSTVSRLVELLNDRKQGYNPN